MTNKYTASFWIMIGLIFLIPIFFLPSNLLFLNISKTALLTFGAIVCVVMFIIETSRTGELTLPWHYFLGVAVVIPFVYLLSALMSVPASLALFGYELEVGTFVYMTVAVTLLVLASLVFTKKRQIAWGLIALMASLSIALLYAFIKIVLGGDVLSLGLFPNASTNPLGQWTDIALASGLVASLSVLAIMMTPASKWVKTALYAVFAMSVFVMIAFNFSLAFGLTLASSIVIYVYLSTIEKRFPYSENEKNKNKSILPILLGLVSLLFLINPVITGSGLPLGDAISSSLGIENTDIRPSFASTLNISANALKKDPLLGSGPNTFSRDWLAYKSEAINQTPFWNVTFPFGIGFIPTQIATTGAIGTILWIAFLVMFVLLGVKALRKTSDSRSERFLIVSTLLIALFVWVASFFYAPSLVLLTVAFIFSGLFVASAGLVDAIPTYKIKLRGVPATSFASTLVAVIVLAGSAFIGLAAFQKTASAYHYMRAIALSGTPNTSVQEVEDALVRALRVSPTDLYYVDLSQLSFSKAQAVAVSESGDPDENRALFESALSQAIAAAQAAVELNPNSYRNWINLGSIYAALVPEPLNVEGSYEGARNAYEQAALKNPQSPEPALLIARLEISRGENEIAREKLRESLALKPDYASAYFILAQLSISEENIEEAIKSAETGAILSPGNPGLYFEIGLLKYSTEDYSGAATSFNQALDLVPDYANAKYYLGLSLARTGNIERAIALFEDLAATNPESEEVTIILSSLQEGKDPLEGIPDESASVENRDTLPVSSTSR